MKRIPALDGLRGLLALVVVSEHALLQWNNAQFLLWTAAIALPRP